MIARLTVGLIALLVIAAGAHELATADAGDQAAAPVTVAAFVATLWAAYGTGSWTTHRARTALARARIARRPVVDVERLDADGSGDLVIEGDLAAMFEPGYVVYRHYGSDGTCLYVGHTESMHRRTGQHMRGQPWSDQVARTVMNRYATKPLMIAAERDQIAVHRPVHNVVRYGATR